MLNGVRILLGHFFFFFLPFVGLLPRRPTPKIFLWLFPCTQRRFFFFFHIGGLCTPSTPFNITGECILAFIKAAVFKQRARPTAGPQSIVRGAAEARPDDHRYYCFVTSKKNRYVSVFCLVYAFLQDDEEQRCFFKKNDNRMRTILS